MQMVSLRETHISGEPMLWDIHSQWRHVAIRGLSPMAVLCESQAEYPAEFAEVLRFHALSMVIISSPRAVS
jgi:hypothetical protein